MGPGVQDGHGGWRDVGLGLKRAILSLRAFLHPSPLLPQDAERLCFLSTSLRPFQALLGGLGSQGGWASPERVQLLAMRLDLRDLQRHLRFQVECSPRPPWSPETKTEAHWLPF